MAAAAARTQTKTTRTALRYIFQREFAALLHHNGFTIARRYGDWDGEPLSAASPSIIVVCRKRTWRYAHSPTKGPIHRSACK